MSAILLLLSGAEALAAKDNLLVIIADDVGVDSVSTFRVGSQPASTPTLTALARSGVAFTQAWANPVCSPTRASIVTGQLPSRNGIGGVVTPGEPGLDPAIVTLPEALPASYQSAILGKWHLGQTGTCSTGNPESPVAWHGFDYHAGTLGGEPESFESWTKTTSDAAGCRTDLAVAEFAPCDTTDETLDWVRAHRANPWMAIVAYNAAHAVGPPWVWEDVPESCDAGAGNYTYRACAGPTCTDRENFVHAIELMDDEIANLLSGLGSMLELRDTTIVFVGDNGTSSEVIVDHPTDRAKASVYQGGVHVPLLVADGYHYATGQPDPRAGVFKVSAVRTFVEHKVHVADLFDTLVSIAGGTADGEDSVSLKGYLTGTTTTAVHPGDRVITESYTVDGTGAPTSCQIAIRNKPLKLIRSYVGGALALEELYKADATLGDAWDDDSGLVLDPASHPQLQAQYDLLAANLPHACNF